MNDQKMKLAGFITLPNRDQNGFLIGTKDALVIWECPTCGQRMGDPKLQNLFEDGQSYAVHVWTNDCGHIAKYQDLQVVVTG